MGWFILVVTIVFWSIALISSRTLRGQARALENFIKGMTLPITDVALTMIPRRLFRANVGAFIGGAPALIVVIVIGFSAPQLLGIPALTIFLLLFVTGSTAGTAIACTTNVGPSAPELPRVARATRPRMVDYLSPAWVAVSVAICAAGLVVASVALSRVSAGSATNVLLVVMIAVNVVTLAVSPLLARHQLGSPQPANDSLQVAWDDAMRSHGLRNVWLAPFAVGVATTFFGINVLMPGASGLYSVEYLLAVGLVSLTRLTRPGSRFQRRLWPITPQPVVGSYAE